MVETALADLRVLDLSHYIAGPYCTKLLADYGADVIKIERPDGGDPARRYGPFPHDEPHPEKSALFLHLNTNKRGITLNLKNLQQELFTELVRQVDVVVENFHPRVMPGLGLLRNVGTTEARLGDDVDFQFRPDRSIPGLQGPGHPDLCHGWTHASDGCRRARAHQNGREPDAASWGCHGGDGDAGRCLGSTARDRPTHRHIPETHAGTVDRRSTFPRPTPIAAKPFLARFPGSQGMLPRGIYPCQDGYVCIHVTNEWWPRLTHMLERPDLLTNPPATVAARMQVEHQAEFDAFLYPWLLARTKQEIMERAQSARVLATAVNTPEDVLHDRHFRTENFCGEVDHPSADADATSPPFA